MRLKDFQGFRFGKTHTSDLGLEVVSTSNRYEARILPNPNDYVNDVPNGDGQYYYGSTYKNREISCNLAFDSISEQQLRKIRQLFATDKLLDLVFDEEPYKTWKAKIKSKPEFKFVCFTDKESGQRVYKGEGKLTFICYSPYAFGFDKYVVRAADYYMLNPPECIINEAESDNTFVQNKKETNFGRMLPEDGKYHYNSMPSDYEGGTTNKNIFTNGYRDKSHRNNLGREYKPNGNRPWQTGFPTTEQVQAGELFFDTDDGKKTILDVRGYWDNVPEWEGTAKLLTTPTLDFEQELIYLPQFSKTNYVNMETGFDSMTPIIGSRLLVYNPGDIPVDWELKFNENKRGFWSTRGGTKFRIRRFNVERLPLEKAVDWCGLKTYEFKDNERYKYGTKYFKRRSLNYNKIEDYLSEVAALPTLEERIRALKNLGLWIAAPQNMENSYTGAEKCYTVQEILASLKLGAIPVDKRRDNDNTVIPYSNIENWKEIYKLRYRIPKWNSLWKIYADYNYTDRDYTTPIEKPSYSVSFDLRLKDGEGWNLALNDSFSAAALGKFHPHHCYYVEPIPKEKLGDYIKLFYWQTIQWRGEKTNDGRYANLDNWKTMLPKEFFDLEKLEEGIYLPADDANPIIPFLKNFITFSFDGMETRIDSVANSLRDAYELLDFEEGIGFANRYEELYNECIDDMERYELYWDTLKKLLEKFYPIFDLLRKRLASLTIGDDAPADFEKFDGTMTDLTKVYDQDNYIENFINSYINHPQEFIGSDMRELNYNEVIFNGYKMPQWITEDYMEVDQKELSNVPLLLEYLAAIGQDNEAIFNGNILYYTNEDRDRLIAKQDYSNLIKKMDNALGVGGCLNDLLDDYYYLNTETRMLYTTANPYGAEFVYKPTKVIMNEAITQGKWFKLPPGWSLISIEPVVDETLWGGKRWVDARPFDWGYSGDIYNNKREAQQLYDYVYERAREEFFKVYSIDDIKDKIVLKEFVEQNSVNLEEDGIVGTEDNLDELLKFKIWYEKFLLMFPEEDYYFMHSYFKKLRNDGEYDFIKIINDYWNVISPYFKWTSQKGIYIEPGGSDTDWPVDTDYDITGCPLRNINGDISDWWWYACNYFWNSFPPPYWGCADMLNNIQIKYTPLFY